MLPLIAIMFWCNFTAHIATVIYQVASIYTTLDIMIKAKVLLCELRINDSITDVNIYHTYQMNCWYIVWQLHWENSIFSNMLRSCDITTGWQTQFGTNWVQAGHLMLQGVTTHHRNYCLYNGVKHFTPSWY